MTSWEKLLNVQLEILEHKIEMQGIVKDTEKKMIVILYYILFNCARGLELNHDDDIGEDSGEQRDVGGPVHLEKTQTMEGSFLLETVD